MQLLQELWEEVLLAVSSMYIDYRDETENKTLFLLIQMRTCSLFFLNTIDTVRSKSTWQKPIWPYNCSYCYALVVFELICDVDDFENFTWAMKYFDYKWVPDVQMHQIATKTDLRWVKWAQKNLKHFQRDMCSFAYIAWKKSNIQLLQWFYEQCSTLSEVDVKYIRKLLAVP